MKKIARNKFFTFLSTSFMGIVVFRNFNFESLRKKTVEDVPVQIHHNPLSVSRNKSGVKNV